MSQLEYYGATPVNLLPHKSGLATWGVILIVCGGLAGLMAGLAALGAVVLASGAIPNPSGQSPAMMIMAVGVYVVAAVALIALGIGSLKGRRWVRPLMMVGSVLTMISGLASLPTFIEGAIRSIGKPSLNPTATAALPAGFDAGMQACSGFFILLLAEVLPAVLLWFYGRASVKSTLELLDPKPRWTDRCPIPVLGWSIGCVLLSLGLGFVFVKGAFPFFNQVLVGMGLIIPVALGVMMLVGGILCFRQSRLGWVLTMAATVVLAGSYATFACIGDKALFLEEMTQGMPAATREMAGRMSGGMMITQAAIYSLAVVYALWLSSRMKTRAVVPEVHPEPHA